MENEITAINTYIKTDEEIKTIALAVFKNDIFGSWQLKDISEYSMVFLVLTFIDIDALKSMEKADVVHFFEYYSKAGPMAVNGKPTFFSCGMLTRKDFIKMIKICEELQEAADGILKEEA